MGLNVDYSEASVEIKKENFDSVISAVKAAVEKTLRHIYEGYTAEIASANSVADVFDALSFESEFDGDGNLFLIEYLGEKLNEDEMDCITKTIAEFVEDGGYILVTALDVDFSYNFNKGEVIKIEK